MGFGKVYTPLQGRALELSRPGGSAFCGHGRGTPGAAAVSLRRSCFGIKVGRAYGYGVGIAT